MKDFIDKMLRRKRVSIFDSAEKEWLVKTLLEIMLKPFLSYELNFSKLHRGSHVTATQCNCTV